MKAKLYKCEFCWEYVPKLYIYKGDPCCQACKDVFEAEDSKDETIDPYEIDDENIQ